MDLLQKTTPPPLLLVEDNPGDARLIAAHLEGVAGSALVHVGRLSAALDRLATSPVSAVLLDLGLPDSVGLATLDAVHAVAGDTPVIVLTGMSDDEVGDAAMSRGAADYLCKGEVDGRGLRRAVRYALERQRAQREQAAIEHGYRSLFETMTQGMLTVDPQGRVTDANPAAAALLGLGVATLTGRTLDELGCTFVDGAGRPTTIADQLALPTRVEDATAEVVVGVVDDAMAASDVRWLALRATFRDANAAEAPHIHILLTDVTQRQRGVTELAQNDRRLQLQLDLLQSPTSDVPALLDACLEAALALTASDIGYIYTYSEEKQQFVLNSWSREVMEACAIATQQTTYELAATGLSGEVVRQRRPIMVNAFDLPNALKRGYPEGHNKLLRFLSVPVFDAGRIVAVVGVANKVAPYTQTDVLQLTLLMDGVWRGVGRLEAEKAQRAIAAQLVQAQKMEAIGRLTGGVAHDFNNLLSVIINRAEFGTEVLAADAAPIDRRLRDDLLEDLHEIQLAGGRAATLVRQLLAFSRSQVLELATVDLNAVVGDFEAMLRRLLRADITLDVVLSPGLWETVGDRAQLEQALVNLVVNARDAIPGAGRIVVATCNSEVDAVMAARLPGARQGEFVRLTVRDDGCGMTPETLERVFEPFFTTKTASAGTGLGLSMVHGLVQQCDGFVAVNSAVDQGTVFEVYLPRRGAEVPTTRRPQPAPPEARRWDGVTALVVANDGAVRSVAAKILSGRGFEVTTVERSSEALQACEVAPRPFALMVSDLFLPFMGGQELAARVKVLHPRIAVLFVSGCADEDLPAAVANDESVPLLSRPFEAATFLSKIDALLTDGGDVPAMETSTASGDVDAATTATATVEAELRSRLSDALRRARPDDALRALDELATVSRSTANALRPLVADFDYEEALRWLRRSSTEEGPAP